MSRNFQSLNRRLAAAQPSATYRIIDRVAARRADGARIISLCAGEPDFDTPAHIRRAAIDAIEADHTRYTQTPGLRCVLPAGAFYAFAGCAELIGRASARGRELLSDEDVAQALLEEANVAVVSGSAFGLAGYIRIAYAVNDASLRSACEAIQHFCLSLK